LQSRKNAHNNLASVRLLQLTTSYLVWRVNRTNLSHLIVVVIMNYRCLSISTEVPYSDRIYHNPSELSTSCLSLIHNIQRYKI